MSAQRPDLVSWLMLIVLTITWGFSYYFIKHSLVAFNPSQVSTLRMIISGIVLIPFLPKAIKIIPREKYWVIILCAIIGSFLPAFLYPFAQQKISSSLAGIINAFTPVCTFGIGVLLFHIVSDRMKVIGTCIALIGAITLILFKPNVELHAEKLYLLVAFSVPVFYGFNGNLIKKHLGGIPGINMTALMYGILILICMPFAIMNHSFQQIPIAIQQGSAFYHLMALSILGSAFAMALFNILIQRVHVMFAASVTYLMPLVSLVVGWIDGETIHPNDIIGLAFILFGVLLMNGVIKLGTLTHAHQQIKS